MGLGLGLCCLMTPGLSKTFGVMYGHTFLNLQLTRPDIRSHIKWAVSLVIAYGRINLPQGFVWVNILTLSPTRVYKVKELSPLFSF